MKIEKLLNWFESEKKKDEKELNRFKKTTNKNASNVF